MCYMCMSILLYVYMDTCMYLSMYVLSTEIQVLVLSQPLLPAQPSDMQRSVVFIVSLSWSAGRIPKSSTLPGYPLVNIQKAFENGHWNSGFTHQKWWFSIVMLNYQRVPCFSLKPSTWRFSFHKNMIDIQHRFLSDVPGLPNNGWEVNINIHCWSINSWSLFPKTHGPLFLQQSTMVLSISRFLHQRDVGLVSSPPIMGH